MDYTQLGILFVFVQVVGAAGAGRTYFIVAWGVQPRSEVCHIRGESADTEPLKFCPAKDPLCSMESASIGTDRRDPRNDAERYKPMGMWWGTL